MKGYRSINGNLVADEGYFTYPKTTKPGDYTLAKTHYCGVMIDADLATQLIKVWEVMLLDTRPPDPTDVEYWTVSPTIFRRPGATRRLRVKFEVRLNHLTLED